MDRTQISLTTEDRRVLDAAAAASGKSIAALIREAVQATYGPKRSHAADLQVLRKAFGAWRERDLDGGEWVDQLRSGSRTSVDQ